MKKPMTLDLGLNWTFSSHLLVLPGLLFLYAIVQRLIKKKKKKQIEPWDSCYFLFDDTTGDENKLARLLHYIYLKLWGLNWNISLKSTLMQIRFFCIAYSNLRLVAQPWRTGFWVALLFTAAPEVSPAGLQCCWSPGSRACQSSQLPASVYRFFIQSSSVGMKTERMEHSFQYNSFQNISVCNIAEFLMVVCEVSVFLINSTLRTLWNSSYISKVHRLLVSLADLFSSPPISKFWSASRISPLDHSSFLTHSF